MIQRLFCLWVCCWGLEIHHCCPPKRSVSSANYRLHICAFLQRRLMSGGRGVFAAWSSLETSRTGWTRVSKPSGHILSSWRIPWLTVREDCIAGVFILCLNGLNQSFFYVEASDDLHRPQACMPDSVKHLLEVYHMKLWNILRWCCWCLSVMTWLLKICSTVLWPGVKPACSSASSSSALVLWQVSVTRSIILLGWLIRLMLQ